MFLFSPHSFVYNLPLFFPRFLRSRTCALRLTAVIVDPTIQPVAQSPRRVPFHVRRQLEAKLDELQRLDIIEPVTGPTPWVSPLVVVPKPNGEVRICVDMRRMNTAVIRERYPIPTIEETLQNLTGACVFSKLDLKLGQGNIQHLQHILGFII